MGPDSNPAAERGETGGENREGTEHWVLTCNGLPPTATTSGPAHRIKDVEDHGGEEHWVLTRHADVTAALADPRLSITNTNVTLPAKSRTYNTDRYDQTLLDLEPPDHTRLRKLVVRRFSAKEVEALRPRIQQITDEVLSNAASNQADLVDTVALEVPVRVICEVLGIPGDACEEIIRKTDMSVFPPQAPMELVYGTLADLIEARRARPTGDLISELVTAHAAGKLTDIELFHFGGMLFFAATKASVHPIRNGTHLILRHPGQLAELRSDPILLPPAVDEMLRHVGPSSAIARYALHDFEVGGVTIPKGSRITLGLTAANHDPDVFAAPDNFDIHRAAGSGLAFGYGIHLCIGARLAKVQTEIVIGALLRRFPERIRDWSAATTHVCQGQVRWMRRLPRGVAMGQPCGGTTTITDVNPATRAVEAMVTAQVIGVAARLGVADHLASGPKSGEDLVRIMGAHPKDGLCFLNACVATGLLAEARPGVYALTTAGRSLRSDGEDISFRNLAITFTGPAFWLPIGHLMETVMQGGSAAESALGMKVWEYYKSHPEEEAYFAKGMSENSAEAIADIVGNYDFSRFTRIVDVGGSRGDLLRAILAAAPDASGVLFDRPETVHHAADTVASYDVAGRIDIVSGSFLAEVPRGGDLYVLKTVLCDWDDAHAIKILENCRLAGAPRARLLVAGMLLPPDLSSPLHVRNLVCRTVPGGRERTVTEMTSLIEAAGYQAARLVATTAAITLVEAQAA